MLGRITDAEALPQD